MSPAGLPATGAPVPVAPVPVVPAGVPSEGAAAPILRLMIPLVLRRLLCSETSSVLEEKVKLFKLLFQIVLLGMLPAVAACAANGGDWAF